MSEAIVYLEHRFNFVCIKLNHQIVNDKVYLRKEVNGNIYSFLFFLPSMVTFFLSGFNCALMNIWLFFFWLEMNIWQLNSFNKDNTYSEEGGRRKQKLKPSRVISSFELLN